MDTLDEAAAQRLLLALDMFDTAVALMEQNLRRQYPEAPPEEIEQRIRRWLADRPGGTLRRRRRGAISDALSMSRLSRALQDIGRELEELSSSWALMGGLAVSARSEPRFTRDIALAVAVADGAEAEKVVELLIDRGYRTLASVEQLETWRGKSAADRLKAEASTADHSDANESQYSSIAS